MTATRKDVADALVELTVLDDLGGVRGLIAFAFHPDGSGLYFLAGDPTIGDLQQAKKIMDDLLGRNLALFNSKPGGHA